MYLVYIPKVFGACALLHITTMVKMETFKQELQVFWILECTKLNSNRGVTSTVLYKDIMSLEMVI